MPATQLERDMVMVLPVAEPMKPVVKRPLNRKIDLSFLKPQQRVSVDQVLAFVLGKTDKQYWSVKGFAGTGKTTTVNVIVEILVDMGFTVCFTATTNTAVEVAFNMCQFEHRIPMKTWQFDQVLGGERLDFWGATKSAVEFMTVHKLFGVKEIRNDETGELTFAIDKNAKPQAPYFDVIITDEVSQLETYLYKQCKTYPTKKFIFVGDPLQIPPVNQPSSIVHQKETEEADRIGKSILTEIVRQGADNPIIELSFSIRKNIYRDTIIEKRKPRLVNGKGYLEFDKKQDGEFLNELIYRYFMSDNFNMNPDFCKVLAWTTKKYESATQGFNRKIRGMIYQGQHIGKIMKGERLIADTTIMDNKIILFPTNKKLEVVDFEVKGEDINDGAYTLNYYDTLVKAYDNWGKEIQQHIKIIHEDSEDLYVRLSGALYDYAMTRGTGSYARSEAFDQYFAFKDTFAQVKYNYAISCHKAQGATLGNVFVYEPDIWKNKKIEERNRIFYTAITRASNLLFIIK